MMETQPIKTVSCYAYDYLGHLEGCYSIIDQAELPDGYTLIAPPFACPTGFVQKFNPETQEWGFAREFIREPLRPNDKGEMPSFEEIQTAERKLIEQGIMPDGERIQNEIYEKRKALHAVNEKAMVTLGYSVT